MKETNSTVQFANPKNTEKRMQAYQKKYEMLRTGEKMKPAEEEKAHE